MEDTDRQDVRIDFTEEDALEVAMNWVDSLYDSNDVNHPTDEARIEIARNFLARAGAMRERYVKEESCLSLSEWMSLLDYEDYEAGRDRELWGALHDETEKVLGKTVDTKAVKS